MVALAKPAIRLESDPRIKRVGSNVMWVAIVVGFMFMGLWLCVAACTVVYNIYWSLVIAGASIAFSFFLGMMARTLLRDSQRLYVLELTDSEAVMTVLDSAENRRSTQMVLLDDITFAEYYPYRDCSSVILHTTYANMEVPLWPLAGHAQDVIDFLGGRGVNVVNVQSDTPFPD